MSYSTGSNKTCYCETCKKSFHPLGIMRHIAMHRDHYEDCYVKFTHGDRYHYRFKEDKDDIN